MAGKKRKPMKAEPQDLGPVREALEALRREVAAMGERVAALEAAAPSAPAPQKERGEGSREDGVSEEIVLVISAAVAAFLGKKPRIRQIRLLGSAAWAQQGRVTIQASHALSGQHR
jgi:methylmalonyl-CoA carboxyltransferase large subunit